jgi:UDP-2-acetamido-2,6-beta-L-arabino-hexul-4-ose reductase
LAAVNRCPSEEELYQTNIRLVTQLIDAMESERVTPYVLFSSSTQEERDNVYGRSKREGRALLEAWAKRSGANFTGLVIPNVFGPFGRPHYNSFVATFAHQLTHDEVPTLQTDANVRLIYVGSLCGVLIDYVLCPAGIQRIEVPCDFERQVSGVLALFERFKALYVDQGIIPVLQDRHDVNLFNTFRSYCEIDQFFPVHLVKHTDARGSFVETVRLGVGGQVSFSTTVPGVTRGNHYHTRKIERFTVVKGKARIQLRKVGTKEVLSFDLDGESPAYVDMPIWYTHNITNIGDEVLYTQFWINEWYDPKDGDTFFEEVLEF